MTTPGQRRRRELAMIIGVAIVAILFVASSIQNSHQDSISKQRDEYAAKVTQHRFEQFQSCITDAFTELTNSLKIRAQLVDPRAVAIQVLIADLLAAKNDPAKGQIAVNHYQKTQKVLKDASDDTPIPPFPTGKCDFS